MEAVLAGVVAEAVALAAAAAATVAGLALVLAVTVVPVVLVQRLRHRGAPTSIRCGTSVTSRGTRR